MTIWLVLDSGKIGGIETHVYELARYLSLKQYQISVIFLNNYADQAVALKLESAGINTLHLDGRLSTFLKLIRKHKPSLLHAHGYKPGVVCKLLGFALKVPVICTHHPGNRGVGRIYWYNWLDENLSFLAKWNIAVNKSIQQRLISKKTTLIPNFIALSEDTPFSTRLKKSIGFVGRFSLEKGPDRFCELANRLLFSLSMHMFGDGEMYQQLKDDYDKQIIFHGNVNDISFRLPLLDLLCITSRSEGLPLVALEAMSLGIPVVAFALGGLPDLIQHGQNGFLIEPNNLAEFSAVIENYYHLSESSRLSLQQAAHQTIRSQYTAEVIGPQIEEVYRRVVSDK